MSSTPRPPVVAVLAGGRGTRLGGRKATVPLAGRPLLHHPLESASRAGLEAVVVAKRETQLPELPVPVIYDRDTTVHPLSGVLAALAEHEAVIAVAGDMPFVPPALLRRLADHQEQAVVTRPGSFLQPFPALYRARAQRSLYTSLMSETSLQEALERLGPRVIEEGELLAYGLETEIFMSVNTQDDLLTAERWIAQRRQLTGAG